MSNFAEVITIIHKTRDQELLEDLLIGITTPKERDELGHRLEIVKRLLAGETHHKIAGDLGVGVATVTRGSRELANGKFKALKRRVR